MLRARETLRRQKATTHGTGLAAAFMPRTASVCVYPGLSRPGFPPLLLEARVALGNDLPRGVSVRPVAHVGLDALKLLVGAEERGDLARPVFRQIAQVVDIREAWVIHRDSQNLLVGSLLVNHRQRADGPGAHVAARKR